MLAVGGTPHSTNLSMVTLFTMHLLRAVDHPGKYLEFSIEGPDYYPWQENLFVESPYAIDDGKVVVPDRPGWGVDIHKDWFAGSIQQVTTQADVT